MLRSGDLDRRVTLMSPEVTKDDLGGEVTTWREVATVWASKTDVSDAERVTAAQVGTQISSRFKVRWSQTTRAVAENWRVRCDGLLYSVVHGKEIGRREGVEISAHALPATVTP